MGFSQRQLANMANDAVSNLVNTMQSGWNRFGRSQASQGRSSGRGSNDSVSSSALAQQARFGRSMPDSAAGSQGGSSGQRPNDSVSSTTLAQQARYGRSIPGSETNRSRLTDAGEGYDAEQEEDEQQQTEDQQQLEDDADGDQFQADFEAYSEENLGGRGISDFMRVDPNSQEDKEAWRAMVEDPTMAKYYEDIIAEYGGFDQYWDAKTANTLADVLADDALMTQYFGAGDISQDIMEQLEYEGYIPKITGDTGDQAEIDALLAADPQAAADLMAYNYRQNLAGLLAQEVANGTMTEEEARGILSLDEYNELGDYGNMQYGYGDGYDMSATGFDPATFEVNGVISANDWNRSVDKGYTSLPGYGLPDLGDDRAIANYLYHAGYQEQEGVPELWAAYRGEDTGEEDQQA